MLIFEHYFGTYADGPGGQAMIQILELLAKCPNVVWNSAGYPPANIRRAEVKVELLEIVDGDGNSNYAPELLLDDEPVMMDEMIPLGRGCFGGIMLEDDEQLIRYFTLTAEQSKLVTMLDQAVSRGALLDKENAEKFSKLLSTGKREQKFSLLIPESLAGPDVLLQPKVELHLEPKQNQTLESRLRVTCTELDDAPTPGLGLERMLVHTPAGVYHWCVTCLPKPQRPMPLPINWAWGIFNTMARTPGSSTAWKNRSRLLKECEAWATRPRLYAGPRASRCV